MNLILLMTMMLFQTPLEMTATCNQDVFDSADILDATSGQTVLNAVNDLKSIGAVPKVVIIGPTENLDRSEAALQQACGAWQSANGGRKTTLVLVMYSPESHHFGLYYGDEFSTALSGQWTRMATQYAVPHIRNREYGEGISDFLKAIKLRIQNSQRESMGNQTVNEATDYSGLWKVMKWLLFFIIDLTFGFIGFYLIRTAGSGKRARAKAQADAINAKIEAQNLLNSYKLRTDLDEPWRRFRELANRVATDPYVDSYTTDEYNSIKEQFLSLSAMIRRIVGQPPTLDRIAISGEADPETLGGTSDSGRVPENWGNTGDASTVNEERRKTWKHTENGAAAPVTESYGGVGGFYPTPVVPVPIIIPVEEPSYREREREREPEPDRSYHSSESSRSDSDSGGGGSFDVSSSSDSGGGSFDTGSSDSSNDSGSFDV